MRSVDYVLFFYFFNKYFSIEIFYNKLGKRLNGDEMDIEEVEYFGLGYRVIKGVK